MKKQDVESIFALNSIQKALYFTHLHSPENDPGFLHVRFTFEGVLDKASFEQAWLQTIQRHESMRMSLKNLKSKKQVLVVSRNTQPSIIWQDIRDLTKQKQEIHLASYCQTDHERGLDLSEFPVMRMMGARTKDDCHQFVWSCHHLLIDGWSAINALQDFFSFYTAIRRGQAGELPTIAGYNQYVEVSKKRLVGKSHEFWSQYLKGFSTPTDLTALRTQSPEQDSGKFSTEVNNETAESLDRVAKELGVTPTTIVYAAWSLILSVLGSTKDIVFGTTTAGRSFDLLGAQRMVGCFANAIPVRVRLSKFDCLVDLLQDIHQSNFASQAHDDFPLSSIQPLTDVAASKRLFDTLLIVESMPWADMNDSVDGGIAISSYSSGITTTYPLTLIIKPAESWTIECIVNGSLSESQMMPWLNALPVVIDRICQSPSESMTTFESWLRPELPTVSVGTDSSESAAEDEEIVFARDHTELEISQIWQEILGIQDIDVHTPFDQLGGRSIVAVRMIAMIEDRLGIRISLREFIQNPTVSGLAEISRGDGAHLNQWQCLVPIQPRGEKPPLMFIHAGGLHVLFARTLAEHLGPNQPLYGFQPVGLDGECKPMETYEEMAAKFIQEMMTVQPEGPYFLTGHCHGARVAFEVARQLHAAKQDVGMLIVLDTHAPSVVAGVSESKRVYNNFANQFANMLKGRWGEVYQFTITKFVVRYQNLRHRIAQRYGSLESKKLAHLREVQLACSRADWRYGGKHYDGKVTLIRTPFKINESVDWGAVADCFETIHLRVGHRTMFLEPDVEVLAACIEDLMKNANQANVASSRNMSLDSIKSA